MHGAPYLLKIVDQPLDAVPCKKVKRLSCKPSIVSNFLAQLSTLFTHGTHLAQSKPPESVQAIMLCHVPDIKCGPVRVDRSGLSTQGAIVDAWHPLERYFQDCRITDRRNRSASKYCNGLGEEIG